MDVSFSSSAPESFDGDVLLLIAFEGADDAAYKAIDTALEGALSARAEAHKFTGKKGQSFHVHAGREGIGADTVVVLGAGPKKGFGGPRLRDLVAVGARAAQSHHAASVALAVPAAMLRKLEVAAQMAAEGALLGTYRFARYLTQESDKTEIASFAVLAGGKVNRRAINEAIKRGVATAEAVCKARDFVNEPAGYMTPEQLAAEARAIAKGHKQLKVKVLTPKECEKLGMGMYLGVGQGSAQEPRFIHMTYTPSKSPKKKIVFVGKGVTFDSGGYSIKPSAAMLDMKIDMSGSAAVIGAMHAIAAIGSPYEVHAIVAAAENMVSGSAYRLGDVLQSMDGKTVEINNTDAEGRLTLGDALTYARQKIEPDEMFDFATLTGACMVALGPYTAGVMSDDEKLVKAWLKAAEATGEDMWRLPLNENLREQLKSNIADMRNTGTRYGGAITAGLFLKSFVGDVPWVHVDIAGPASASKDNGAVREGGVGFGVASIVEYATR